MNTITILRSKHAVLQRLTGRRTCGLASFVYHAAMRDAMLPRKPLPKPRADAR
jgi:hypothetical protein